MPHRPLSVLSHLELFTPDLEASVTFARDMLGMFVIAPDVKANVEWLHDTLDFRIMGGVSETPDAPWFLGLVTQNEKSHDFGFIADFDGPNDGRLHHVAFSVETNQQIHEGAKFLIE